jgi:formylglycine-generating enzyme required for sulfatase activity
MIAITCTACRKKVSVKKALAGKRVKCPRCEAVLTVAAAVAARPPSLEEMRTVPPEPGPEMPTLLPSPADPRRSPMKSWAEKPDPTVGVQAPRHDPSLTDFLAPPQADDELGRLGKYRILKVLGHGGMGAVFLGEDPTLGRQVAIKVMLPHLAQSRASQQRFLREAKTAAALQHDNVVPIFHVDEDRGAPYIVMPLLQGQALDERLQSSTPLTLSDILRIGRETARGLDAAHQAGLIHRDIKPANLWLEAPEDRVKILDFGLARAGSGESGLTQQGAIIGTPAYMSPEQTRGDVDARSDLFSLGVVLYRLSTGQQPFQGQDTVSILYAVAMNQPAPPVELNPELPPEWSALVMQLLEKDRDKRPANAAEVVQSIQALEKKLALPQMATDGTQMLGAPPGGSLKDASRGRPEADARRRRLLLAGAGLLLGLGLVVLLVVLAVRPGNRKAIPAETQVSEADRDLTALRTLVEAGDAKAEQRRAAVLDYCRKYLGTPQAHQAAGLLRQLPPLVNSIGMKLVPIPAGKFFMGSPSDERGRKDNEYRHEVHITRPFYLGMHEVTVGQFQAFVDATHYQTEAERSGQGASRRFPNDQWKFDVQTNWRNPGFAQTAEHPVVCVSWNDAVAFCAWLSKKEGAAYGLPTEAQWEYACRAGTQTRFSSGDEESDLSRCAWYAGNAGLKTHPVGEKQANAWGLLDMHGNVAEWCQDWYGTYEGLELKDPLRTNKGVKDDRVVRGGGWFGTAEGCRAAFRVRSAQSGRIDRIGLRVCFRPD